MANERPVQERLEQVNRAIEKSERVRNFEGVSNLDRQLEGLDVLPVSDHAARLLEIGERRRRIRTAIDVVATQKLHDNKQKIEAELVNRETSILPEQFDPQNPRGLTIQEAAVLVGLFATREPYLRSIGITPLSEETSRAILGKLEAPLSQSDVQKLRNEVFNGVAESVRIGTIDSVLDNTGDDDIRTLLTYVSVFQIDASDEELAQFLEDKSLDFDLRRGEIMNVRFHKGGTGLPSRQPVQADLRLGVDSPNLQSIARSERSDVFREEGLSKTVEIEEDSTLPTGSTFEGDETIGPGYDEPVEPYVVETGDETIAEADFSDGLGLANLRDADEQLPITDEEFEEWYRQQEEVELLIGGESDVEDTNGQISDSSGSRSNNFESRAPEAIIKALEAGLPETFNLGALVAIYGRGVVRAMDRAVRRRLIRVQRTGQSAKPAYTQEQHVLLVYMMDNQGDISNREVKRLEEMTAIEIEKRQMQAKNSGSK